MLKHDMIVIALKTILMFFGVYQYLNENHYLTDTNHQGITIIEMNAHFIYELQSEANAISSGPRRIDPYYSTWPAEVFVQKVRFELIRNSYKSILLAY